MSKQITINFSFQRKFEVTDESINNLSLLIEELQNNFTLAEETGEVIRYVINEVVDNEELTAELQNVEI
jgi:hypothetical protein